MRRFILLPALDVAPTWIDPVTELTIAQLAEPLKQGAGSLCLAAPHSEQVDAIVAEVSRQAMATVLPIDACPTARAGCYGVDREGAGRHDAGCRDADRSTDAIASRWIARATPERLLIHEPPRLRPKLVVLLDETSGGGERTASDETAHLRLARLLRLLPPSDGSRGASSDDVTWPLPGPRYLLNAADRDWAIHELVAALEAMDCPVEPLPDAALRAAPDASIEGIRPASY